jgi:hypothetical protein
MFHVPETTPKLRCPTCGAAQAWSDSCRRCRCDLSLLHQALRGVRRLRRDCLAALRDGRYDDAVQAAYCCCQLDASKESRQLLAMAEFYHGRFATAVRLAQHR